MQKTSAKTAPHYQWGQGEGGPTCDGWRLQDTPDLSVIEERMPPGTQEVRHSHAMANQVFYVLDGELTLDVEEEVVVLGPGDALNVSPGLSHQARNVSMRPARFLVISAPTTQGDRQNAEP